jgi:hypothetical protein
MSKRVEYEEPDWLAESPVSETAQQQTLAMLDPDSEQEAYRQASIAAYTAGFFDGEGSVSCLIASSNTCKTGYDTEPRLGVEMVRHQMAGLFDAEGYITSNVQKSSTCRVNHFFRPHVQLKQVREKTLLRHIFDQYAEIAEFSYNIYPGSERDGAQPTEHASVGSADDIEGFLRPLIPLLYEKRRQALIMVDEILPRYRDGVHCTKRGFVEMMEWKEKLDEAKPMDKEDRKYTVEYFEDLWEEDLENQTRLTADDWSADGGESDD